MTTSLRSWRPGSSAAVSWHRRLDVASGVAIMAAAVMLVWPVRVSTDSATRRGASMANGVPTTDVTAAAATDAVASVSTPDTLGQAIAAGNLFSATRRAPVSRFVVPGRAESDPSASSVNGAAAQAMTMLDSTGRAAASEESYPHLSGIVFTNGERRALLQLAASDGVASLYRVGDAHAGFRVQEIDADVVVLSSADGRTRLHLSSRRLKDSLEVHRE